MLFYDTETCGLHGPTILIQYAYDDGPIYLHNVWYSKIKDTLELIEEFMQETLVGFNLAFDHFHLCQTYTTLSLLPSQATPLDLITEYAYKEPEARFGPCLKPKSCLDLMLHARKGPYQSTMDRHDIKIKRVPTAIAWRLADELTKRIKLKDVYFARRKDISKRWTVYDIVDKNTGRTVKEFKDVILKFAPSSALKALAQDALGVDTDKIKLFTDVELSKKFRPVELGYAPWALAVGNKDNWNGAWPAVIEAHARHWQYNNLAREYASDDVKYTRMLYEHFNRPEPGDVNSVLACLVGAVRWHGFSIDVEGLKKKREEAISKSNRLGFNYKSPRIVRRYLEQVMSPEERLALKGSTKRTILEALSKWTVSSVCKDCNGIGCINCDSGIINSDELHPVAIRAIEILEARSSVKEVELYDKLITAGRLQASFKVTGTLSDRMSGADDFNPQGIKRDKSVRCLFPLADEGKNILCGGDMISFEVVLADSQYNDPKLREQLLMMRPCTKKHEPGKICKDCKGTGQVRTSIHGLFGQCLFPPMTYEQILATKGMPGENDKYTRSKNGVFAKLYGGTYETLVDRVGVSLEAAKEADATWDREHPVWAAERKKIFDMFCSMRQPGGIGTRVEWHEPADYAESKAGFRRYFTLENMICKALFELAQNPPKDWLHLNFKVWRRDREQSASGAARSACFAAAFAIQAANMRAAANHYIQSRGASITKELQVELWSLQPIGIHHWHVIPMNIHDEIMCPTIKEDVDATTKVVNNYIQRKRSIVPLLDIEWSTTLKSWADK